MQGSRKADGTVAYFLKSQERNTEKQKSHKELELSPLVLCATSKEGVIFTHFKLAWTSSF